MSTNRQERERLLDELEKVATELQLPKQYRRDWRWIKRHSMLLKGVKDERIQKLLSLIEHLELAFGDCVFIFPVFGKD